MEVLQINFHEKKQNPCYYYFGNKFFRMMPDGSSQKVTAEMLYNDNCYLHNGLVYFYPYIEFIFEDYSSELKFFETVSLAKTYMEQNNINF